MTIYLDVIFVENIIMNYIILYGTAIIAKVKPKHIRIIIASAVGAIYAIIAYCSVLKIYSTFFLKLILSIIIVYLAFKPQNVKKLLKQIVLFYLTSFAFGGSAFFLIFVLKPQDIIIKNGVYVGTYPLKVAFLGGFLGFIIITLSFNFLKTKLSKKMLLCKVKISIDGKKIETVAMIDTGNLLRDPISNSPVIVIEHSLLYDILPKQILNNLEKILGGDLRNIPNDVKEKYISKLKVIPFTSLGKQNGMLLGIKADRIYIESEDIEKVEDDIIIGIYNKSLTKHGEYRALIGMNLL